MKAAIDPFAIFAPPILTLIVVVLGYLWGRAVRRGKPLSSTQRAMLTYSAVLVLGLTYAEMLEDELAAIFHWKNAWIAVMVAWGALLAAIAWMRYRSAALPRPPAAGDGGV
jgi:hypothetical protein